MKHFCVSLVAKGNTEHYANLKVIEVPEKFSEEIKLSFYEKSKSSD